MTTHSSIPDWRIPWIERGAWWASVHRIAKSWTRFLAQRKPALQQMLKKRLYSGNTREGKELQKINPKQLIKWQ